MDVSKEKYKMQEIVKKNGKALEYASGQFKNDEDIVTEAVRQNGDALEFASADCKNNYDIVMESVSQNGWSLRFASDLLWVAVC